MKKIIDGKRYDTETAEKIASYSSLCSRSDFNYYEETLYRTKAGRFFLAGSGGPMTKYAEAIDSNSWSGGSDIIRLTKAEAQEWLEEDGSEDALKALEKFFAAEIVDA